HAARQLARRRAQQPCLGAAEAVARLALGLGAARERRDRADDAAVDTARAYQGLGDLERLLAGVRLADEELVDVDTAGPGIGRVEGMLDVDECRHAATALGLGDDVLADRRLARRLRAEDLGDPAARDAADPEGEIERDRTGRDDVDRLDRLRPE